MKVNWIKESYALSLEPTYSSIKASPRKSASMFIPATLPPGSPMTPRSKSHQCFTTTKRSSILMDSKWQPYSKTRRPLGCIPKWRKRTILVWPWTTKKEAKWCCVWLLLFRAQTASSSHNNCRQHGASNRLKIPRPSCRSSSKTPRPNTLCRLLPVRVKLFSTTTLLNATLSKELAVTLLTPGLC